MDVNFFSHGIDDLINEFKRLRNILKQEIPNGEQLTPTQSALHDSLTKYLDDQETCIEELENITEKLPDIIKGITTKYKFSNDFSVFIFGSMARFEYVREAKVSTIGILPIFRSQKDISEEIIGKVLDVLKCEIKRIFGSKKSKLEIDIHTIKTGQQTYFSAEDEIIELIGKEYERSWSSIERSCLLWEAVCMKDSEHFDKKLREKLLNFSGCLEDLREGRFPTLLYVFSQEVLVQGLANEFRKSQEKIVSERITPQEKEQVKLMFSRFVGIKVKQLALHLIFWIRQKDDECLKKDWEGSIKDEHDKYLNRVLNRPPIILGLNGLNDLVDALTDVSDISKGRRDFVSWLEKESKVRPETIEQIKKVFDDLKNCLRFPKKEGTDFSVGEFMLDLWYKYQKSDLFSFETEYVKNLGKQTWKLVEITGRAAWITQQLETIRLQKKLEKQSQLDFYEKSWYLLQPAIFPEYRKDSNTVETEPPGGKMLEIKTPGGKMPENSPIRIFISHSHADSEIAKKLVEYLKESLKLTNDNIRCTSVPGYKLPLGKNVEELLRIDINGNIALIGLLTERGLDSQWVLFELGAAWGNGKLVIPILGPGLRGNNLPGPLKSYTSISIEEKDVHTDLSTMIQELADYLEVEEKHDVSIETKRNEFIEQLKTSNTPPAN